MPTIPFLRSYPHTVRWGILLVVIIVSVGHIATPVHAQEGSSCRPNTENACPQKGYNCERVKVTNGVPSYECTCQFGKFEALAEVLGGKSVCDFLGDGTKDSGKLEGNPLMKTFTFIANALLALTVGAGLIMVVWSGYLYMTAGGSGEQITTAKSRLRTALIGIILAMAAFLILNTISPQFASDLDEPVFKNPRSVR